MCWKIISVFVVASEVGFGADAFKNTVFDCAVYSRARNAYSVLFGSIGDNLGRPKHLQTGLYVVVSRHSFRNCRFASAVFAANDI